MALNGNKRHTAPVFGKYNNNKKTDKNKQKIQIIEIKTLHQISTATADHRDKPDRDINQSTITHLTSTTITDENELESWNFLSHCV